MFAQKRTQLYPSAVELRVEPEGFQLIGPGV
jgi:hypothetical protein